MKRKQEKEIKYRKRLASVTQWQSNRLLTGRLRVRVPPGALFISQKGKIKCYFYKENYVTNLVMCGNQNLTNFMVQEYGVAQDVIKLRLYLILNKRD